MRLALKLVTGFAIGFTFWLILFDRSMVGEILIGVALSVWGVLLIAREKEAR